MLLDQTEDIAVKAIETLIAHGIERAMAEYNGLDLRDVASGRVGEAEKEN